MLDVQWIGTYSTPTRANAVPHNGEIWEDVEDEDPGL